VVGDQLVGVYAGGSYALGAYEQGRSDLDVAVVVASAPPQPSKEALVCAIRHESLPCPARGLELVLYTAEAVGRASTEAAFELNLNTGAEMPFRVDFEPESAQAHWFPIDRSILAEHGIALLGPPAPDVFASIPRDMLLPLLAESLQRQAVAARNDDVVLNACRTWMYIKEGVWSSKPAAGGWAADRAPIAARALDARHGADDLSPDEVRGFVDGIVDLIRRETFGA
jgi:hypothetical protein